MTERIKMEDIKNTENGASAEACNENAPKKEKKTVKAEELLERLTALEAEMKEKDDKYLRMAAEYDNFRRRSREEKDATYENAMADTRASSYY